MPRDRAGPPSRSSASCGPQPFGGGLDDAAERSHLILQVFPARASDAIGLAPVVRSDGLNPAALLEAGDRAVEGAGPECTLAKRWISSIMA